jgi:hypothetical protein
VVTTLTPARLEVVRIVREHCTTLVELPEYPVVDVELRQLADTALDTPVEVMAGWVQMDETVMANIRLVMSMVRDQLLS